MKEVRKKLQFNIDIVNHCNLNCIGCGHFSPLATEYFLPVEEFKKDCERLNYLTNGDIERMEIMGGEPLLHPSIIEIIKSQDRISKARSTYVPMEFLWTSNLQSSSKLVGIMKFPSQLLYIPSS